MTVVAELLRRFYVYILCDNESLVFPFYNMLPIAQEEKIHTTVVTIN